MQSFDLILALTGGLAAALVFGYLTLRQAGAEVVVSAEWEVGLALTEIIMHQLGATPDQIDHERERVRSELQAT